MASPRRTNRRNTQGVQMADTTILPETLAALKNIKNRYARQRRKYHTNPLTDALDMAWSAGARGNARMRKIYLDKAALLAQAELASR